MSLGGNGDRPQQEEAASGHLQRETEQEEWRQGTVRLKTVQPGLLGGVTGPFDAGLSHF